MSFKQYKNTQECVIKINKERIQCMCVCTICFRGISPPAYRDRENQWLSLAMRWSHRSHTNPNILLDWGWSLQLEDTAQWCCSPQPVHCIRHALHTRPKETFYIVIKDKGGNPWRASFANHMTQTQANLPWRQPWKATCKLQADNGHTIPLACLKTYFFACSVSLTYRVIPATAGNVYVTSGVHVHNFWKISEKLPLVELEQLWNVWSASHLVHGK